MILTVSPASGKNFSNHSAPLNCVTNPGSGVSGRGGVGSLCGATGLGFGGRGSDGGDGLVYFTTGFMDLISFLGGGAEGGLGSLGGFSESVDFIGDLSVPDGSVSIGERGVMVTVDSSSS